MQPTTVGIRECRENLSIAAAGPSEEELMDDFKKLRREGWMQTS